MVISGFRWPAWGLSFSLSVYYIYYTMCIIHILRVNKISTSVVLRYFVELNLGGSIILEYLTFRDGRDGRDGCESNRYNMT